MPPAGEQNAYCRYTLNAGWEAVVPLVVAEATVSLTVNGKLWLSFACTPDHLDALAAGFLFNEGIINQRDEIAAIDICKQGDNVDVWLHHAAERPESWRRTSGCTGGATTVQDEQAALPIVPVIPGEQVSPEALLNSMQQLLQVQDLYHASGGVHCSALSDGQVIRVHVEDIGRHNTLDKVAGQMLLDRLNIHPLIVLTTGRVSSEMLQKSARMGASIVVSRTSPTTQSVEWANRLGVTLVGYARRSAFSVYAHPERISGSAAVPSEAPGLPPAETPWVD